MLDALAEQIASLRRETEARHLNNVERADERHEQVIMRLNNIDSKISGHGERMSAVEAIVNYLKGEWAIIRDRYHILLNAKQTNPDGTGDIAIVRRIDVKMGLSIFVGGMATIMGILKLMGKL